MGRKIEQYNTLIDDMSLTLNEFEEEIGFE